MDEDDLTLAAVKVNLEKNKRHKGADPNKLPTKIKKLLQPKKAPGRPKQAKNVLPGQQSILKFVDIRGRVAKPQLPVIVPEPLGENEIIDFKLFLCLHRLIFANDKKG